MLRKTAYSLITVSSLYVIYPPVPRSYIECCFAIVQGSENDQRLCYYPNNSKYAIYSNTCCPISDYLLFRYKIYTSFQQSLSLFWLMVFIRFKVVNLRLILPWKLSQFTSCLLLLKFNKLTTIFMNDLRMLLHVEEPRPA